MENVGVAGQKPTIDLNPDIWAPHRGKYMEPTPLELLMICPYIRKFHFEEDDFVEDAEEWRSIEKILNCTNLRRQLITFLHQVRESRVMTWSTLPLISTPLSLRPNCLRRTTNISTTK